ncbi:TipJ family phage tail tip protein [Mannheimia haemolytica]|uniref:TipJ family phage tail tip protein n=2 Tax=Mannheimia haemolytica TaxID=75985 RepID=UPI001F0A9AE4|nr:phage tail protein [Mannheimia haemolytica]
MRIYGAKGGGGSSHTPIEAPETGRSKQIVNIVELLCEGEIEGLVDGFKSIYLDGTQIQNDDGTYNFNNVSGQLNVGTQDQDVLDGYDSSQNEVNVGVEIKKKNGAIVRTVTDERINRLRLTLGVRSLFHQNNQGDTNTTNVDLKITIGTRQYSHSFNGKYSSQYLESVVFDNLPPVPFNISVERLTEDSNSQRLQNGTIWSSYTEIIDTEFTYPNSAVAGISFDSEYFNNIPTRNYLIKAKKVKVPSNYDPVKRTYTGFWDGTFKVAWTNNPAWEIYDLAPILSKMLGVEISFDKWALYDVARYCDQLVPDGMGGMEPRFTCNVWLTEVKTAYDLLNDFCSVFRAIPIWTGTEVSVIIDRPRDPVWTYTNANVVGGFERSYSARKSRHNAVQVTYSDKTNGYESAIEYVSDDEEIKKHGLNLSQITAFGCTSRGQAHRTGKWILETEKREKETITFTVGREGLMHLPGDIIRVADSHYAGTEIGGRVLAINGRKVTLDREISIDNASYFTYINGEATHSSKIQSVNGKEITLDSTPTGLETYGVWSLSTKQISSGLYRSISIVENADGTNTITALQHEPQKEAIVDNSAHFVETARTLYKAPQINAVEVSTGYDGKLYITGDISSGDGKLTYDIKITKDGNLYQYKKGLSDPNIELSDLPNGDYTVIIYGKNAKGQIVTEKTQTFTIDRPPAPTGVVVTGGLGQITLEWDWVNEVTQTEIFAAETDNFALAKKIAKVTARTYAHTLKGNKVVRYYWLRHTRGINVGPFYQQQGVRGQTAVDLDARLTELNTQLSRNIVNEVFDVAAPARGLELVKTVANLTDKGTKLASSQVYNQADGKLYTWNGTAYSATVAAEDVTGKLSKSKIDTSLISQLTGADNTANLARRLAETAQSNINQEITNRQDAVTAEANNRTKAIQAESANLTKKIQAEATARGAAVTQLQNVDAQQAQLISAVTAKADNALSGLEEEKTARANADKAESQAREALTARMGAAESNIVTIQRTVANNAQSISEVSQNLNAKIDNINIGGRNLLRDSEFNAYNKWGSPQIEFAENANRRTIKVTSTGTNGPVGIVSSNRHSTSYFQQGETYTLSLFARGSKALDYLYLMRQDGNNVRLPVINVASETEFNHYKLTFKAPFTTQQGYVLIGFRQTSTEQFVEFHSVKLEKGNVATDWTPAPEDVESAVSAVSADLTSYKQTQAATDSAQAQQLNQLSVNLTKAESNLNAKITEEKKARVDADKVNADKLTDITSRVANAESTITNFQSTKANKSEVASIAQQNLQSIWRTDAQSAVDALKIGGANLLVDSEYLTTARWGGSSRVASSQYGDRRLTQVFVTQAGTGHFGVTQGTQKATTRIRQGETYTLSLNAQGTAGFTRTGLNYVYLIREDGGNFRLPTLPLTASLSQRPKVTFTAPWTSNQVRLLIGANGIFEATDWFAFHSVKLEMGNVATGWTPTAKDIDDKVSAVQSNLTAYQAAQAKADQAKATQISGLTTRMGAAESNLTRTERAVTELNQTTVTTLRDLTARTKTTEGSLSRLETAKANKTEVASIAQSSLQSIWKADAKSAVDSLSIGARNLLIDSTYNQHINYNTKMSSITRTVYRGNMLIRLGMLGGAGVAGIVQAPAAQVSNIRQGQEYTLSLNVQGTAGIQKTGLNYVFLMRADGANQRLATIPVIASLLNRPKITFTAEWTSERAYLLVGVNGTYETTDWLAFHSVKLEKGNVATDWTPAPEDVDSAVSAVSAKIDTIQETLANADSALSSRIDTVNASVGSNSSKITQVSNAVASVDGKLSATHTIKTETIAGGRKAIAGIAFGATADNRNAESSVIVMADKFEVVKNAQDGTPVRLFGVVENKVAINGNLIATGSISGDHINANSVRTAVLTAGAIKTEHLAAGQISADKLAIGLGGNLLVNPIFATPDLSIAPFGWNYWRGEVGDRLNIDTRTIFNRNEQDNYGLKNGGLPNELVFSMRYSTTKETSDTGRIGWLSQDINVVPNKNILPPYG